MNPANPIARAALWLARDTHRLDAILAAAVFLVALAATIGAVAGWDLSR